MPCPRIAIVTTIRSPGDSFKTWIDYHRGMVDKIYIYLDEPGNGDEALIQIDPVVNRFAGSKNSTMSGSHGVMQRQMANVKDALTRCAADRIDWLFHIDDDELIYYPGNDLRTYFGKVASGVSSISFVNHEVVGDVEVNDRFKELHLFKKNTFYETGEEKIRDHRLHGFLYYEMGKSAVRVEACNGPCGVHEFFLKTGAAIRESAVCILHYPCPSYVHWLKKYSQLGDFKSFWWDDPNLPMPDTFHTRSRDAYRQSLESGNWEIALDCYMESHVAESDQAFMLENGAMFFADPLAEIGMAKQKEIFVSIASYQDPMLLFTLNDAIQKARHPESLRFAVIDQRPDDQRAAIDALPCSAQIRYLHLKPCDTLGVSWARHLANSLYDGEAYLLQIDSHTLFEADWDATLRTQHDALLQHSSRPLMTTYPYRFDMVNGEPVPAKRHGNSVLVLRPVASAVLADDNPLIMFGTKFVEAEREPAVPGCHIAGGFIFCAGRFIDEVPYDPYLYFQGEEQNLSVRAYTRGWDIFHPASVPLYHLYKEPGKVEATHHWHGTVERERAFTVSHLTMRSRARMKRLLYGDGLPGQYGLGQVRSLEDYIAFSGIDYKNKTIADKM